MRIIAGINTKADGPIKELAGPYIQYSKDGSQSRTYYQYAYGPHKGKKVKISEWQPTDIESIKQEYQEDVADAERSWSSLWTKQLS